MAKQGANKKLGLDIGTYAVKLVELQTTKEECKLATFGYKKIEGSSAPEALAGLIKSVCDEAKVSTKYVNIAVSGPQVITRFVSMPNMSDNEMKNALGFEVEKNIPFSAEEVIYDYQVIERGKEKQMEVLLTAVKRDYIDKYIKLVQSCGLVLEIIDVDSFALVNVFLMNFGSALDPAKTVGLLNIGDRNTNLIILRGQMLSFCRDIQQGGREFNEAIARLLNVDAKGAEKLKHQPQDRLAEIALPVRTVMANLVDELRLSFGYFENRYGKGVDEVYISGGSANLAGLKEFLEENLGVKVASWDPLKSIATDKEGAGGALTDEMRRTLAVSVGLALR